MFGVAGVGAGSALISVLLLKGADGSLRHSVHRTATEVLFLPLPSDVRERFKAVIDALGQRGGQAVASLAILGAVYIGAGSRHLAMALGLLITIWIVALLDIKRHYLDLFRGNLREGMIATRVGLSDLDLHSLEALVAALSSESDAEVLAALDLFHRHHRVRLVPVLVLYHPSTAIVLRALELFAEAGREDFGPVARRLLRSDDGEIRAAALRALASLGVDEGLLRSALADKEPLVHTTSLVGLLSRIGHDDSDLSADLERHLRDESAEVRRAMASAIRYQKDAGFADALLVLAESPERDVRLEVARAMTAIPNSRYLHALVEMLADSRLRPEARKAIVATGPVALYYLDEALWDTSLPRRVRRHLPRTISRFPPAEAAEVLAAHLSEEVDEAVQFKILRGLGRLRAENPTLVLDDSALEVMCRRFLQRMIQVLSLRLAVDEAHAEDPSRKTRGGVLLRDILVEKERTLLERIFRVLGLLYTEEDFELIFRGLTRRGRSGRAQGRELLDYALRGEIRGALLALVDDAPDAERLAAAEAATGFSQPRPTYERLLSTMLEDSSEAVQAVAAHHIAELGLTGLAEELRAVGSKSERFLGEVVERALSALDVSHLGEDPHAA
jgi:HEAT repeat protein